MIRLSGADRWLFDSLTVRVLVFLTLALLPLGIVAILQTDALERQSRQRSELALLSLTRQAAFQEVQLIQNAFGAADALGTILPALLDDPEVCSQYLKEFQANTARYSFVAFVPPDGKMTCASGGSTFDFSGTEDFVDAIANPRRSIVSAERGMISDVPVLVVAQPVYREDQLTGFVTMSIPQSLVEQNVETDDGAHPFNLILFNDNGQIVTAERGLATYKEDLPQDTGLLDLVPLGAQTFEGIAGNGQTRAFAVTPVIPGVAYALGSWPVGTDLTVPFNRPTMPVLLPILMWAASLLVAFLALDRLVLRNIKSMGAQMQAFAADRTIPDPIGTGVSMPAQLRRIQNEFVDMADAIVREEARQEDSLREKNILIKEVYHRVKNNLQLISSIMNLQIRSASSPETKIELKRLQDRIRGLAQIHRTLYQSERMDRINAAEIVREVASGLLEAGLPSDSGVTVLIELQDVSLYPDQAMPLSLLVSEAMTNAIKYVGTTQSGERRIAVTLGRTGPKTARVEVTNSLGEDIPEAGTMLGLKLVRAFAAQLGGTIETEQTDALYRISASFPLEDYDPSKRDF